MNDGKARAWLTNIKTGATYPIGPTLRAPDDGGEVSVTFDLAAAAAGFARSWRGSGSMWDRFGAVLTPFDKSNVVSIGEGNTPLVRSERFARELGLKNLFFKLEGSNPTGSFKDRQMSVALSMGRSWGRTRYATVSSGNVGNALSAYCARAGYDGFVLVAEDTADGKRDQISVYGAQLYLVPAPVEGRVRAYWQLYAGLGAFCAERGIVPMISARPVNPFMVEGTKTIAFEVTASLGGVPDAVFCCVGGGGLLGGVHKGFAELVGLGQATRLPVIHGGQRIDRHYAPIDRVGEEPYRSGDYYLPLDADWAMESIRSTGGTLTPLGGDAITEAQAWLATREGIFAEPQGAYATAALMAAARAGSLDREATYVCIVTGMGLKDMGAARRFADFVPQHPPLRAGSLADLDL